MQLALTATHLGGGVAARRADLLLLVEGGATAPPAGRVGLGMPLTERSRSLRLFAGTTIGTINFHRKKPNRR